MFALKVHLPRQQGLRLLLILRVREKSQNASSSTTRIKTRRSSSSKGTRWLKDYLPSQQGLRRKTLRILYWRMYPIKEHLPQQQGLRLFYRLLKSKSQLLKVHLPWQQGLRQFTKHANEKFTFTQSASSLTTRIKTWPWWSEGKWGPSLKCIFLDNKD